MKLSEFLEAASADDETALVEANEYTETTEKLISSDLMAMLLVDFKLYDAFKAHESEAVHAFMDRVLTASSFNFYEPSPSGAANFKLFDALGLPVELRATLAAVGSETINPFERVNLYQVKLERGTAATTPIAVKDGYAVLTVSADCPLHSPMVRAANPRTGKNVQIGAFSKVGAAGKYDLKIQPEYRNSELHIVDAYGLFS